MGLDMYALKIRALTDEELAACVKKSELPPNVTCILDSQLERAETGIGNDLEGIWSSLTISVDRIDIARVMEDYHIPLDWRVVGEAYGQILAGDELGARFTFAANAYRSGDTKSVELTAEQYYGYAYSSEEPCKLFYEEEVGYWRKAYDLCEAIEELYDGEIVNCGYHKANREMRELMKENGADIQVEDEDIFFHEWY